MSARISQHKELKRIKARDKMHEEPIIKEMAAFYLEKYGIDFVGKRPAHFQKDFHRMVSSA